MTKDNKEDALLLNDENENLVVEGTVNQKDNKKEATKSAERTEQNLTNTDVANNQNLQYEQGLIQKKREDGSWYKMSRAEKKEIRRKIAQEEDNKARKERESKFVEQKEDDNDKESGPNDSQKQFDALQGKKLEPQYIADNNEIQRDDIMNKELNKNLEVAKENNEKVFEEEKKKREEQEKKANKQNK